MVIPQSTDMNDDILVLNSGSSSIKFSLFNPGQPLERLGHGVIEGIGGNGHLRAYDVNNSAVVDRKIDSPVPLDHPHALELLLEWGQTREATRWVGAIGHRVVHGGTFYAAPVLIDATVINNLETLVPLAPLHQCYNLAGVRALAELRPDLPQVACFDTAFHNTQTPLVQRYALPRELSDSGVRRYGFHGLSYEYIASTLPEIAGTQGDGKVVVAHLGNGASLCAIRDRKSVDSTMGFTALDGLPMGRRCGALDPGVILYLLGERKMTVKEITNMLYRHSGLLGMSGISNDMRILLADDRESAREAIDVYVYRIARELGAMAAALGGLDVLIFTGGIGENAAPIRERVCQYAHWLGVHINTDANNSGQSCITLPDSPVTVYVVPTDEELMIARHTRNLLATVHPDDASQEKVNL